MSYAYRCIDDDGVLHDGILPPSGTLEQARDELEAQGWTVLQLRVMGSVDPDQRRLRRARLQARADFEEALDTRIREDLTAQYSAPLPEEDEGGKRFRPLTRRSLALFFIHLRAMLAAGVPYLPALEALSRTEDMATRGTCHLLMQRLRAGRSLAQAMAMDDGSFSPVVVNLVHMAEKTGQMDEVLRRLGRDLSEAERRRSRLVAALMYPAFVIGASLAMVTLLLYYMVPRFLLLFAETGLPLPPLTRLVLEVSRSPVVPGLVLLALAGFAGWIRSSRRTPAGPLNLQKLKFETPWVGRLNRQQLTARIARQLALLLRGGTPLTRALQILGRPTTGYYATDEALVLVNEGIQCGLFTLSSAMAPLPVFPPILVQFVRTGEESKDLPAFLDRYADVAEQAVDMNVETFLQMIEPMVMLVLGFAVGIMLLAAFLPIYQLVDAL